MKNSEKVNRCFLSDENHRSLVIQVLDFTVGIAMRTPQRSKNFIFCSNFLNKSYKGLSTMIFCSWRFYFIKIVNSLQKLPLNFLLNFDNFLFMLNKRKLERYEMDCNFSCHFKRRRCYCPQPS